MSEFKKEIKESENEVWKSVLKYPRYEVSNLGKIRNLNGRLRYPSNNGHGYRRITIKVNDKCKTLYIHRAVLEAFSLIENYENLDINHIDFNRSNNRLENLEWKTHKRNMQISFENGSFRKRDIVRSKEFKNLGDNGKHRWSKLNKSQIEEIYSLWRTGSFSYKSLGERYNITGAGIKAAIVRWENVRYK